MFRAEYRTSAGLTALTACSILLAACTAVSGDPDIWSLRSDPPLRMWRSDLGRDIAAADIVLAGERHDNPHHHAVQAEIVRAAAADGRPVVLVFEMLDRDQQAAIDAYLAAGGGDAIGFADATNWTARGWPDPVIYAPLFNAMFEVGATVVAGDLPRATIRRIGEHGPTAAPPGLAARFALDRPLPPALDAEMRAIQRAAHCGLLPDDALSPMVGVQRARDAALAGAILDAHAADPGARIVLIAGRGHVRKDHGVGALLRQAAPGLETLTIGLGEGGSGAADLGSLAREFDVVWLTPEPIRADPCAELRKSRTPTRSP